MIAQEINKEMKLTEREKEIYEREGKISFLEEVCTIFL